MPLYNYTIARKYSNVCKFLQIYWSTEDPQPNFHLVQQFNSSELFLSFRYESSEEFNRSI